MLYLVIFVALALGFYAQVSVAAQLSANERRASDAQVAAESGVAFLRHRLSTISIPPTVAPELVLKEIHTQLAAQMNFSGNLGGTRVLGYSTGVIEVPAAATDFIPLQDKGPRFRATLTQTPTGGVRAKVTGTDGTARFRRAIQVEFGRVQKPSTIFEYGVATRGSISLSKAYIRGDPAALGDVLSAGASSTSVSLGGNGAAIDGKVYLTHPGGTVTGDGSVNGVSDPALRTQQVVPNTPPPEFPGVDPSPFVQYMQGKETLITGNTGLAYHKNIRIKAGANPTFSGGPTIEGVILIEAPNVVNFTGITGTTIRGVIVAVNPTEATSTNAINFTGGTRMYGVETLDATFGELKTMLGSSILAPNFALNMSGGSSTFGGTVLAKSLTLSGGSGGTLSGNLVLTGTSTLTMTGESVIKITPSVTTGVPAGIVVTHSYGLLPKSYLEVTP